MIELFNRKKQALVSVVDALFLVILNHLLEFNNYSCFVVFGRLSLIIQVTWLRKLQWLESDDLLVLHLNKFL